MQSQDIHVYIFKHFKIILLAEMLNLKKYSYLTTQKIVHAGFSLFTLFILFFYKMCTFSLHKHTTANFRCTCIVLLLSYTGDSRAAFNMPLTSHLYTRIDTWFIYLFIFVKERLPHSFYFINPISHFLQQCHNEDWLISDSILPILKYWHKSLDNIS